MIIQVNTCTSTSRICAMFPVFQCVKFTACKIVFDIWIYFQQLLFFTKEHDNNINIIIIILINYYKTNNERNCATHSGIP